MPAPRSSDGVDAALIADARRHDAMRMNLGVYALGTLDVSEQPAVVAHLRGCSRCRTELSELSEVADLLRHVKPDRKA